jgi:lipopolysaccharide transport system ATP-binding protein
MSDLAVRVENLSKLYKIGARKNRHDTLRDQLMHGIKSLFSRNGQPSSVGGLSSRGHSSAVSGQSPDGDFIWALKDVSFEIKQGEVVGFVGRNGAGKSTLLKILSQITKPTAGRAELFGRVGCLLEVGTGFHAELTGRENIYLSGAILGMKKWEIDNKFDEIVAFSEIEKFIDTPVKRYSSGMYVRLAFAVAAHLEPEILIVDEVLAVGDAAFQRKCLGKMGDVAKAGRTVLFVSHNMAAVARLCGRGILLENGFQTCVGSVDNVIDKYQMAATRDAIDDKRTFTGRTGSGIIRFKEVTVLNQNDERRLYSGCTLSIQMELEATTAFRSSDLTIGIGINGSYGDRLITLLNKFDPAVLSRDYTIVDGTVIVCNVPRLPLRHGVYYLSLYIDINGEVSDAIKDALQIEIHEADFYGTGIMPSSSQGPYVLNQSWHYANKHKGETDGAN